MNTVIKTIMDHRSIRSFEDQQLTQEQIETIVSAAQSASTSSFIQAYSIIGVTDKDKKKRLAELAGHQSYVEENGHFFVFCADLYRHTLIGKLEDKKVEPTLESTEKFMVAIIDTALAAQNAVLAAESMGLGVCYIGGLRNNIYEVADLLQLPERVIPLFGLAVGFPKKATDKKPRLPLKHIYHENTYQGNEEEYTRQLMEYNETVSKYYEERTNGKRKDTWTGQMGNMLEKRVRMNMKDFVESKKFNLL
jgi:FMN reductase (NADPH)